MKKYLFLILCCTTLGVWAQDKTSLGVSYQYAVPTGAFKNNFIDKGSARGLSLDLMYAINPKWRLGGAISYQDFYQKDARQMYTLEDGSDLSAVQSNSIQTTPLMAKALYLPSPEKQFQPYISVGAGVNLVQVNQMLGGFDNINDVHTGFAAQGGLGVKYAVGKAKRTSVTANAAYNYMPFNKYDIGSLHHVAVGVGLRFTLRNDNRGGSRDDWQNNKRPSQRYYGW